MFLDFDNKTVRKLIMRMARLAEQYKEPYDSMDYAACSYDSELEAKWNTYVEILEDITND